jgi:hypothetical protein
VDIDIFWTIFIQFNCLFKWFLSHFSEIYLSYIAFFSNLFLNFFNQGALAGSITSLIIVSFVVFGAQSHLANGTLKHRTLPFSTHECPANTTVFEQTWSVGFIIKILSNIPFKYRIQAWQWGRLASVPVVVHVLQRAGFVFGPVGWYSCQLPGQFQEETSASRPLLSTCAQLAAQGSRG